MAAPFADTKLVTHAQHIRMCLKRNGNINQDPDRSYCEQTAYQNHSWAHWRFDHWVERIERVFPKRIYCRSRVVFIWTLPWPLSWGFTCEGYIWEQFKANGTYDHGWKVTACTG
jgi:hypothetical protein